MRFERFTDKARQALTSAQNLARRRDEQEIELEHLLAALLEQDGGTAPALLMRLGLSVRDVRDSLDGAMARFPKVKNAVRCVCGNDSILGPLAERERDTKWGLPRGAHSARLARAGAH